MTVTPALQPVPPAPAAGPLAELVQAALDWHHTGDAPPPRTRAELEARHWFRAAAVERLHAAAQAYEDAPQPAHPVREWLADRGLATRGDWLTLGLFVGTFTGIAVWCVWMTGSTR